MKTWLKSSALVRFVALRGFSFLLVLLFIWLLVEILGFNYRFSYLFTNIVNFVLNFFLTSKIVFKKNPREVNLFWYTSIVLVCIYLSSFLLKFLKEGVGVHYLLASVFSVLTVMLVKYFAFNRYVFKK